MDLNPRQKLAVQAPNRPLLIVAGAGTGKTRTLTSRLVHLLESGVSGGQICALTFTNKAAREMASRVSGKNLAPGIGSPALFIGTFHSLGAQILRSECRKLGRTPNFAIFDDHDSYDLIKKITKNWVAEKERIGPAFFASRISEIKNGVLNPTELQKSQNPRDRLAFKVFGDYESKLAGNNAFDFDDLIQKVVNIWRADAVCLEKYRRRFTYILIDEYQDLNNKQYQMIRLLAGDSPNVTVVGDDQQMIYSWRGSNFEIFLNFERDWPEPQVILLEENYRSSGNIIRGASAMIQNNLRQKTKNLWTKNPDGELIKVVEAEDEEEEARFVAEKISNDEFLISNQSVAVLYRTNAQSRAVEQALIEREIPYQIFGGIKFYERREIKDIVAGLRYAVNPKDELSRERLEKTFRKGVFAELRNILLSQKDYSPVRLIKLFLEATDYLDYLERNFANSGERKENIAELVHFASQFELLPEFLEQVALLQATDTLKDEDRGKGKEESRANLMTIHLAKGLEFDNVFVIGCSEGLLPHARSMDSQEAFEEERRLMYVAMTRAKKELFLSYCDLQSRFLSEIPEEFTEFMSLVRDEQSLAEDEEKYVTLE